MNFKYISFIIALVFLSSCVKDDFFGASEIANIKNIVVSNQSGNPIINIDEKTVTIEIAGGVNLSEISVQTLELSSFTKSNINTGDIIDLNNEVEMALVSESGTTTLWTLTAFIASETPQLANGNLNNWYKTATDYFEPGENAETTIWATGNRGTQLLNKLATYPKDFGNDNLAATMETLSNGTLGATFGTPISAGSLFTGVFNPDKIDPNNPEAATEFGTPFAGRPLKIKLKYSYEPGEKNKDKAGKELSYGDAADIYALLEVRLDGTIERLATAWLRASDVQTELITVEIPFTYGELDSTFPDYTLPENGLFVDETEAAFIVSTHITFVASSSFDGANFAGAVGSKLVIDDIELIYE